jgi:uncharacterized membrane protein
MTGVSVSPEITNDDKLWSALAYPVAPLAIFLLLVDEKKKRPFIKYHAIQALAFSVPIYAISILFAFTVIGTCLLPLVWAITLIPAINSYRGNYTEIPLITNLLKKQKLL